ncbi:MAG TPA: tetraacyldisaccharide 4'-kinase, partial [Campylobacterales bacterium]|nr:tetraacyldisaccharide 4'-kinase [Campylobacterales bacterium]
VSVGNLTVGGSGKTPFVIALALCLDGVCIISRGYGRESRGLVEVSDRGKILTDVYRSGDEPMLMANSLPKASVIVSEDRHAAIALAIQRGAKVIILDDGFNRGEIQKFEILLSPEAVRNPFPFPAGPFREWYGMKKYADLHLTENQDFERHVEIVDSTERMLLVTAISNPERLDRFLPEGVVARLYLEDHAYFDEIDLRERMVGANATSLLVTQKDQVKMEGFKLPLSVMQLKLQIKSEVFDQVDAYVSNHSRGS